MTIHLQKIGAIASIGIVIGSIVGTGIFVTPAMVARFSTDLWLTFALWAIGGFMCAVGGEIYGKLGQRFPSGGGQYIYLEKTLGKDIALVYGWMCLLVISPSMIAGYSMFFAEQAKAFFPQLSAAAVSCIAVAFISLITTINYLGMRATGTFEKIVVSTQICLILALFSVLAFTIEKIDPAIANHVSDKNFSNFAMAIVGILWSYEGFNSLSFVAHEIHESSKNLTKYILTGCGVVMILYFLLNYLAISYIQPQDLVMMPNIAVALSSKAFGAGGENLTLLMMIVAVFMTAVPAIMIGPRVTEQMAKEGWLPKRLGTLHPKFTSPSVALILQCFISSVFALLGNFESLITCFIAISWCFYILVAIGFILIEQKISTKNPWLKYKLNYKPISFILLAGVVLAIQIKENLALSLFGIFLLISSYFTAKKLLKRKSLLS